MPVFHWPWWNHKSEANKECVRIGMSFGGGKEQCALDRSCRRGPRCSKHPSEIFLPPHQYPQWNPTQTTLRCKVLGSQLWYILSFQFILFRDEYSLCHQNNGHKVVGLSAFYLIRRQTNPVKQLQQWSYIKFSPGDFLEFLLFVLHWVP